MATASPFRPSIAGRCWCRKCRVSMRSVKRTRRSAGSVPVQHHWGKCEAAGGVVQITEALKAPPAASAADAAPVPVPVAVADVSVGSGAIACAAAQEAFAVPFSSATRRCSLLNCAGSMACTRCCSSRSAVRSGWAASRFSSRPIRSRSVCRHAAGEENSAFSSTVRKSSAPSRRAASLASSRCDRQSKAAFSAGVAWAGSL